MSENLDKIELRSEEVQEILSDVPNWMIRWGSALFLSLIVLLLFISWFVKYPDVIPSKAVVTTQTPPEKQYARTTGKIQSLLVKDNEIIQAHTPLAILENTANYKDVYLLKSVIDTIQLSHDRFYFPLEKLPVLFLGDIEVDYALFENSYSQYILNKELNPYANEALANKISLSELSRRHESLQAQKGLNESELNFKKKDLERSKSLFDRGVISAQEFENKQLEYLQSERDYRNMNVAVSQIREAISQAQKTSKGTTINQTRDEITLLKNVIQSFNQLKKSIRDWEMRYVLQSGISGKVTFLNYWNENQTVNQGDLVFTVIPIQNQLYIAKLKASSLNSGKIKIGQKVNVSLQNFPEAEFGTLTGTVKNISLVPDNEGMYLIDVALPQHLITSYNKEIEFKQEMMGTAEIITEDLRLIERLFYQFRDVFDRTPVPQ